MSRTSQRKDGHLTYGFTIHDVKRSDTGNFFCNADNNIGQQDSKAVTLIVRRKASFLTQFQFLI